MPGGCLAATDCLPVVQSGGRHHKTSRIKKPRRTGSGRHVQELNIDFILRAGVLYINSKYFVGASFVGQDIRLLQNSFSLNNRFGILQVYAGFNFYLKRNTRKVKYRITGLHPLRSCKHTPPYYILPLILLPLPAIKGPPPSAGQRQRDSPR